MDTGELDYEAVSHLAVAKRSEAQEIISNDKTSMGAQIKRVM